MLRAHLTDTKFCYLHPHRAVLTACARCRTPYCDECLETRDTGLFARIVAKDEKHPPPLFCERCVAEVEALTVIRADNRLHRRLRPTRAGIQRAAIWVAILSVIMVPMALVVRNLSETTLTPEELARIKLGLTGGFATPDGINLLSQPFGGTYIRASAPSQRDHEPTRLIDTWSTTDVPAWRSADANVPIELVFALPQQLKLTDAIIRPHPSEPGATWVRDFELLVSADSAESGFTRVASGRLPAKVEPVAGPTPTAAPIPPGFGLPSDATAGVKVSFPEASARFVMLRVLNTYGSPDYASLAELEVYWTPPSATPNPR